MLESFMWIPQWGSANLKASEAPHCTGPAQQDAMQGGIRPEIANVLR